MIILALFMPTLSLGIAMWWYMQIEPTLDAQGNRIAVAKDAKPLLALLFGGIVSFGCFAYHDYARPILRAVPAAPFPTFTGCPVNRSRLSHYVPQTCVDYHFAIGNTYELGLADPGRGNAWYRIGDDALLLRCFSDRSIPCRVEKGELNLFVRLHPRPTPSNDRSA